MDPPEEVVGQLLGGRSLERRRLHTHGVHAGKDVLDRAVLAAGIHRLEHDEQEPVTLRPRVWLPEEPPARHVGRPSAAFVSRLSGLRAPAVLAGSMSSSLGRLPFFTFPTGAVARHRRSVRLSGAYVADGTVRT